MSLGVFTFDRTPAPTTPTEVVSEVIEEYHFDTNILHVQFCGDTLPLHQATVAKRYQNAIQFYDHPSFQRSRANYEEEDEANRDHSERPTGYRPTSSTFPISKVP